jgi:hypothetical protein
MKKQQPIREKVVPEKPVSGLARLVPMEKHYDVFKAVEGNLKEFLAKLDHRYTIAGMRVAYDELDSANEPFVLPYSVDFGFLGDIDKLRDSFRVKQVDDEEFADAVKESTIPLRRLDTLYKLAKDSLQEAAGGKELKVGVHIVLTGSQDEGFGVECPCSNGRVLTWVWNKKKQKYVSKCRGKC